MTDIKICGVRSADIMDAALDAGADYVGLVFFAKSPRNVALADAARLADQARGRAKIVALVVDAEEDELRAIAETVRPDAVQFHGHETAARLAAFRATYSGEIWKAAPVSTPDDLAEARALAAVADRVLFDARPAAGDTRPGGNGRRFDWTLLAGLDLGRPFVLSGGLDPENVAEAVRITGAPMVDVSSGVESAPGIKDPARIAAFARAVREPVERPLS